MRNNVASLLELAIRSTAESLLRDLTSSRNSSQVKKKLDSTPDFNADPLTSHLLRIADTKYMRFDWTDDTIISIIHEKTKTLNLTEVPEFGKLVTNSLSMIPNNIQCIESFIFKDCCADEDIIVLNKFTQVLEEVDVEGSYEVTDAVVDILKNLKNLRRLNLAGTKITPSGITQILEGNKQLIELSVNEVLTSDIDYMQELTNLRSLKLDVIDSDVSSLKYLKNLDKIGLRKCNFHQLRSLLLDIGKRLLEIQLEEVQQIDLQFILRELIGLTKLSLKKCSYENLFNTLESMPAYNGLTELEIVAEETEPVIQLLMCCKNLEKIRLDLRSRLEEVELSRIIHNNKFTKLRTFALYTSRQRILSISAIEELLTTAEHLTNFTHLGVGRISGLELENLQKTYPRADINITTTSWSVLT
ncbi:hypothetical protein C0J52_10337 [Blattella germanica]|nr:hypothetical protein C0J52_10337 [Blattella germanica]